MKEEEGWKKLSKNKLKITKITASGPSQTEDPSLFILTSRSARLREKKEERKTRWPQKDATGNLLAKGREQNCMIDFSDKQTVNVMAFAFGTYMQGCSRGVPRGNATCSHVSLALPPFLMMVAVF